MTEQKNGPMFTRRAKAYTLAVICFLVSIAAILLITILQRGLTFPSTLISSATNFFLGLIGIGSTAIGSVLISYQHMKDGIREDDQERLNQVTSIAANQLNNIFQSIAALDSAWKQISRDYSVHSSTDRSMSASFYQIRIFAQSTINTIISISGSKENPFGLVNFQDEVKCAVYSCDNLIKTNDLPNHPGAKKDSYCKICKSVLIIRRHHDGSISASMKFRLGNYPPSNALSNASGDTYRPTESKMTRHSVICPNADCGVELSILVNEAFPDSSRPCPECKTVFVYFHKTGQLEIKKHNFNKEISQSDITYHEGDKKVQCGCKALAGVKYLSKNSLGESYLECYRCGSIMTDNSHLLES